VLFRGDKGAPAVSNPHEVDFGRLMPLLDDACRHYGFKHRCTIGTRRRITRWEHEHVLDAVQPGLSTRQDSFKFFSKIQYHLTA
jgi:hypothetical protein